MKFAVCANLFVFIHACNFYHRGRVHESVLVPVGGRQLVCIRVCVCIERGGEGREGGLSGKPLRDGQHKVIDHTNRADAVYFKTDCVYACVCVYMHQPDASMQLWTIH